VEKIATHRELLCVVCDHNDVVTTVVYLLDAHSLGLKGIHQWLVAFFAAQK
jgi:hypothetical protein